MSDFDFDTDYNTFDSPYDVYTGGAARRGKKVLSKEPESSDVNVVVKRKKSKGKKKSTGGRRKSTGGKKKSKGKKESTGDKKSTGGKNYIQPGG